MPCKETILSLLFILMGVPTLNAQDTWDLIRCINFALEHNIELKGLDLQEQVREEEWKQSKRQRLPSVGASGSAGMNFGRSIDPNNNSYVNTEFFNNNYSINSSIDLFRGFSIQHQVKYHKYRKQVAQNAKVIASDDLAFNVMTAYYDVVYYKGMQAIADSLVQASKLSLKTAQRKVELGILAKSNLLDMRANLEQEKLNQLNIQNYLEKSLLNLKQLLNFVSTEDLRIEEALDIIIEKPQEVQVENLFEQFTAWSPNYQNLDLSVKLSEKTLHAQKAALYPTLSGILNTNTAFYETNKSIDGTIIPFSEQLNNNRNSYVGVSLNIPIFYRWSKRSQVKVSKLEWEQSKTELADQKQRMFFKMLTDLSDLKAYYQEYQHTLESREVDKLAYKTSRKKFDQGLIDINDYYLAKNRLAQTESQILRAKLQWIIKQRLIDFYQGHRFWE